MDELNTDNIGNTDKSSNGPDLQKLGVGVVTKTRLLSSSIRSFVRRNRIVSLILLMIILIGLPAALYLSGRTVKVRVPAADEYVDFSFSPSTQTMPPDSNFRIMLSARTNNVSFVRVVFSFDPAKVKLSTEIVPSGLLSDVVAKTSMNEANITGLVYLVMAVPPQGSLPTGVIPLADFSLKPATTTPNVTAGLAFFSSDMQVVTAEGQTPTINVSDAAISLYPLPTATPTSVPTNTPIPATPTVRPTNTPIPVPTNTPTPRPTNTPTPLPTNTPIPATPTVRPTNTPTPSPLSCTVTLLPSTYSLRSNNSVGLTATVTTTGGATVNRVTFASSNSSVMTVSPTTDYTQAYQTTATAKRVNQTRTATVTATVYLNGTSNTCTKTSTITVTK